MVEPMKYGFERIQSLIECEHCFRGEAIVVYRHLRWRSVSIASYAFENFQRDAMVAGWRQPSELWAETVTPIWKQVIYENSRIFSRTAPPVRIGEE